MQRPMLLTPLSTGSTSFCSPIPTTSPERVNIPILQGQWLKLKEAGLSVKITCVAKKCQGWDSGLLFGFRAHAFFTMLLRLTYFMADPANSGESTTLLSKPQTITLCTVRWHSRLSLAPWSAGWWHLPLSSHYFQTVKSSPLPVRELIYSRCALQFPDLRLVPLPGQPSYLRHLVKR